jgi:hypothetical protein
MKLRYFEIILTCAIQKFEFLDFSDKEIEERVILFFRLAHIRRVILKVSEFFHKLDGLFVLLLFLFAIIRSDAVRDFR